MLIFQRSQLYLEDTFKCDSSKVLDKDKFLCHLHTVGEVAMHNPRRVDEKTFQLLQRFLFISDANSKNQFLHLCIFYQKSNIFLNLKKCEGSIYPTHFFRMFLLCHVLLWCKLTKILLPRLNLCLYAMLLSNIRY
jgi:hypothetical protein